MPDTTDIATLKAKIITKISLLTLYLPSDHVFDYEPDIASVSKDPYATVTFKGLDAEFETNTENKRLYTFSVIVFVERSSRGNENAEQVMDEIIDLLIDDFDQDETMTGSGIQVKAAVGSTGYIEDPKEARVAELLITVQTSFDTN